MDLDKMAHFESKVGNLKIPQAAIYNLISDFNNLKTLIPPDKVQDLQCTEDTCSFTADKVGKISLRIIEKEPQKTVKIGPDGNTPFEFIFWVQLLSTGENESKIRLTIKANLNAFMKMMVSKPLKNALDNIIDQLEARFN